MRVALQTSDEDGLPEGSPKMLIGLLAAAIAGAALAVVALPPFVPALAQAVSGESPKAYWFLARSSAFVAFVLLWLSTVTGLLMTGKLAQATLGQWLAFELHQFASLLGLAFTAFHALILLGDRYINYSLAQLLLPFGSANYRPLEVGLGQIAFYASAVIAFSFYARRWIGTRAWRVLHFLSFAAFALALAHGVLGGTDTSTPWAQAIYWIAGGSVLFLTIYRALSARVVPAPRAR